MELAFQGEFLYEVGKRLSTVIKWFITICYNLIFHDGWYELTLFFIPLAIIILVKVIRFIRSLIYF